MIRIAEQIWNDKYRFKDADGNPIDQEVSDTFHRVANALAEAEYMPSEWAPKFFDVMKNFEFIPAGRILAGSGTGRAVTLSNCFTMGAIPDDMGGIFEALKEAALTMQQGGGIGYDFSTLRPKGATVKGVAADASGPLSFMDVWDAMCRTIMSAGSRRGAMMATMRCDHPDIEAFIRSKKDPARLRMFNLSVLVTDAFMAAVEADGSWKLQFADTVYKTLPARDLWNQIMQSTYDQAEPGVIFIDRINTDHNLSYLETIATTNPCGEKPMGPYASCLLGSINLAKMVLSPYNNASLDMARLREVVTVAIRMMDNVIEVGQFPLIAQLEKAKNDRQLGLGITGLADALLILGIRYGSPEAAEWLELIMKVITETAYITSTMLAQEKGSFKTFDANEFLKAPRFASRLPEPIKTRIRQYGIRNSLLISIAPTGTISLFAGNVSSGIEPIFAAEYERKVLQDDGTKRVEKVTDYAVAMCDKGLPPAYVDTQTLTPIEHLRMQAAAQKWVDSSISKTINLPESISFKDFQQVYLDAYDLGCKGCTTYRPNAITGSVLSVKEEEKLPLTSLSSNTPKSVPDVLQGVRYKIKLGSDPALYVHINDHEGQPFEIFFNGKDVQHQAWMAALSRMISAIFRRGGDVDFVIEELRAIHDPVGGGFWNGKRVPSLPSAIGDVIAKHMGEKTILIKPMEVDQARNNLACSMCNSQNITLEGGCFICLDCGHSKCS